MLDFIHKQAEWYIAQSKRYDEFEIAAFPERVEKRGKYWNDVFDKLRQAFGTPSKYIEILNEQVPDYL